MPSTPPRCSLSEKARGILPSRSRLAAAVALLAVGASGCSYVTTTKKLDMQPFAENTVTAIGEMRRIETPPIWVRLRPYFGHPTLVEARKTAKPLLDLVRGVNAYSLQVVALNESRISERNKVRELARFLHGASQQALLDQADVAEIALTPERREALLKEIEGKETFMGALLAAEPIVSAVLARGLDLADDLDRSIVVAATALEVEVQGQYGKLLANRASLIALQEKTMKASARAESLGFGNDAAADDLRASVPVLVEYLPAGRRPTPKDQQAMVAALSAQALRIKVALDEIDPQYQAYRESILELDTLRARATDNAKLARSVLMIWSRSHKNLARGVEVPPMFDLAKIVMSTATTAAKGFLPF
jgi:hypothetical protein